MGDIFWVEEPNGQPPVGIKRKRRARKRKFEFVEWGSRPLIEFLEAIDQDTTKKHSQRDVETFITRYIKDNSLASQMKKKKVQCDERLYALFGKKSIYRNKIYEMLTEHFAENHSESDSELDTSEEEDYREKGSLGLRNNVSTQMKKVQKTPRSGFAAIVPENIKLIYLKKSLMLELLKVPESFESKIMGSFVRMKSDPNDIYQKNRFQLQQVTGVEKVPGAGNVDVEIHLKVANFFKDIPICELSDDNFSEEEIVDLQDRMKAGLLKRPTISDLELKAEMLHEDITKHWIGKELVLLQKLINRANEKGWRREFFEHLERRKMLQTESEQEKLLHKIPEVIAEVAEPEDTVPVPFEKVPSKKEKIRQKIPEVITGQAEPENTIAVPSEKTGDHFPPTPIVWDIPDPSAAGSGIDVAVASFQDSGAPEVLIGDANDCVSVKNSDGSLHAFPSAFASESETTTIPQAKQMVSHEANGGVYHPGFSHQGTKIPNGSDKMMHEAISEPKNLQEKAGQIMDINHTPKPIPVIELSDDEDDDPKNTKGESLHLPLWHYIDPQGQTQGPFSVYMMRQWRDANYFPPDFMVWRIGQTSDDAILLADVLRRRFS